MKEDTYETIDLISEKTVTFSYFTLKYFKHENREYWNPCVNTDISICASDHRLKDRSRTQSSHTHPLPSGAHTRSSGMLGHSIRTSLTQLLSKIY